MELHIPGALPAPALPLCRILCIHLLTGVSLRNIHFPIGFPTFQEVLQLRSGDDQVHAMLRPAVMLLFGADLTIKMSILPRFSKGFGETVRF